MQNVLIRFILPMVLIYVSYSYIGPVAGIITVAALLLFFVYLNRAAIYANMGNRKYQKGDFNGALMELKMAVKTDPKAFRVRGSYAYLLVKLGDTEEAAVQIEQALKDAKNQDINGLRLTRSLVLWKQGRLDEAIDELTDLLKVYETTNVYATLGFLYIDKGDLEKALEFNLKAKEYNSGNAIILDNLGTTYILLGEYDKAFEIYKAVMKLKPAFPEAYFNYGRVLDHTGDLEKALYMVRYSLSLRFWNISTIRKEEVEAFLAELEAKQKAIETDGKSNQENTEEEDNKSSNE